MPVRLPLAAIKRKHADAPAVQPVADVHDTVKQRLMRLEIVGNRDFADRRAERGQADAGLLQLSAHGRYLCVGELRKALPVHAAQLQQRDVEFFQRFELPVEIGRDLIGKCRKDEFSHICSLSVVIVRRPQGRRHRAGRCRRRPRSCPPQNSRCKCGRLARCKRLFRRASSRRRRG